MEKQVNFMSIYALTSMTNNSKSLTWVQNYSNTITSNGVGLGLGPSLTFRTTQPLFPSVQWDGQMIEVRPSLVHYWLVWSTSSCLVAGRATVAIRFWSFSPALTLQFSANTVGIDAVIRLLYRNNIYFGVFVERHVRYGHKQYTKYFNPILLK